MFSLTAGDKSRSLFKKYYFEHIYVTVPNECHRLNWFKEKHFFLAVNLLFYDYYSFQHLTKLSETGSHWTQKSFPQPLKWLELQPSSTMLGLWRQLSPDTQGNWCLDIFKDLADLVLHWLGVPKIWIENFFMTSVSFCFPPHCVYECLINLRVFMTLYFHSSSFVSRTLYFIYSYNL